LPFIERISSAPYENVLYRPRCAHFLKTLTTSDEDLVQRTPKLTKAAKLKSTEWNEGLEAFSLDLGSGLIARKY
jgi:hypothetical protein